MGEEHPGRGTPRTEAMSVSVPHMSKSSREARGAGVEGERGS